MHVRCPHCHQPVELVDNAGLEHIDCPSCGSHFSLLGEQTASFHPGEMRTIGHFELIERLGMGQFGTVWMARDTELDRPVAVKIPRQEQLSPADVEMFLREARAAAQLHHPNIVSVHEVGREGDTVYIVSDLVKGVTLADRLTAGRLSPREAAQLCVTIAEALQHAHQAGVIHRDLKPSNIMLDAESQPHLMDFGLAKREAAEITMTMDGKILGTPAYMSPEQARGEAHDADARSDIYSLGTILFELLTGELPFRGNKRMLLMQIIHDDPPSPRKLDAAVPRDLETIALKCLEKSPERRYATAREVADELWRFLAGQPILARPVGHIERGWRWCRRNSTVAVLAASVILVLLAGVGVSTYFAVEERIAKLDAERAAAGERKQVIAAKAERDRADREAAVAVSARKTAEEERANAKAAEAVAKQQKANAEQAAEREKGQRLEVERQAAISEILRLAAQSQAVGAEEPIQSVLLALEAVRLSKSGNTASRAAARQALRDSVGSVGGTPLPWPQFGVDRLAISPDGHWLLTVGSLRPASNVFSEARLWDLTATEPASSPTSLNGATGEFTFTEFGSNGRWLATRGRMLRPNAPRLWDLAAKEPGAHPLELLGHAQRVSLWATSADGHWLATTSREKTARIWDLTAGEPAAKSVVLHGHDDIIDRLAFSANGRWLVTRSVDKTARVWDLATSDPSRAAIVVRENFPSAFIVLEISADGHWLATKGGGPQESSSGRRAQLWDLTVPDPIAVPLFVGVNFDGIVHLHLAISPDGHWLAIGHQQSGLYLWDLTVNDPATHRMHLGGHSGPVEAVLISPDSHWLVSGGGDNAACIWDLATNDPAVHRVTLRGHNAPVGALSISRNGRWLASGSDDKTVRVWDLAAADPAAQSMVLRGCEGPIRSTQSHAISPNGDWVAAVGSGGLFEMDPRALTARIWNLTTPDSDAEPVVLRKYARDATAMAMSPDGRLLVTGDLDKTVRIWHLTGRRPATASLALRGHEGRIRCMTFSPSGRWLVTAGDDAVARLWDISADDPAAKSLVLHGHEDSIHKLAISADSRWLATASSDKTARLWDLMADDPGAKSIVLSGHEGDIYSLTISPDSHWLATGSSDKTARLWDLTVEDPAARPIELRHPNYLSGIAFSSDKRWLATACFDCQVRLWNLTVHVPTAKLIVLDEGHSRRSVVDTNGLMAFSPDGHWLATNGRGGTRLWELNARDVALVAEDGPGASSLVFSPDGRWLVVGMKRTLIKDALKEASESSVRLWNLQAANPVADVVVLPHATGVSSIAMSTNGRWLVTATDDKTTRLWDLDETDPAASAVVLRNAGRPLTMSSDSRTLVTASEDGAVRLWSLNPDDVVVRAYALAGRELTSDERRQFMVFEPDTDPFAE